MNRGNPLCLRHVAIVVSSMACLLGLFFLTRTAAAVGSPPIRRFLCSFGEMESLWLYRPIIKLG